MKTILVISWTKILLRVMQVGTMMEVSKSRSTDAIGGKVKTLIIHIGSNMSRIRLVLLLLQLMNEVGM